MELGVRGRGWEENPIHTQSVYFFLTLNHRCVDWAGFAVNFKSQNGSRLVADKFKMFPQLFCSSVSRLTSHVSPGGDYSQDAS